MGTATRVVSAIATGGTSEAYRAVGKKTGYDSALFGPLGVTTDPAGSFKTLTDINRPISQFGRTAPTEKNDAVEPKMDMSTTEADREKEARDAMNRRKRDYKDLGRSGTILTGPQGLGGSGQGQSKSLLGY